jgi:hypothetical protein
MFFCSCGGEGDDVPAEPSAQELTFENLSGQWGLPTTGGIVLDGVDRTLNYAGFNLSFTEGGYITSNAGSLFRATGTWSWLNETTTTQISLDDGKTINIQNLTASRFVFTFSQSTGGAKAGTAGSYTVTVNK